MVIASADTLPAAHLEIRDEDTASQGRRPYRRDSLGRGIGGRLARDRVFREGQEVDVHDAPSTLFGDEESAGSKSCADHRAAEAAVLAYLRRFVAEHDAEE